jgi:hypothetical protein
MDLEQLGESLAEDVLRSSRINTAQTAHKQTQPEDTTVAGQVGDGALIVTMDAVGRCATAVTSSRRGSGEEQNHDGCRCQVEVVESQAGTLRESIEEEGHGW